MSRAQNFQGTENILGDDVMWIHVIVHLSKSTECTKPTFVPNENGVFIMRQ